MNAVLQPRTTEPATRILSDAFLTDPYPTYRALRDAGPLHWSDEFFGGAWLLTRHADVELVLRDPRFSAYRTGGWVIRQTEHRKELRSFQQLFARAMLFVDAPDHTRLRQAMNAGFRAPLLQALRPRLVQCLDQLLDAVDTEQSFDFMQAVARPFPAQVIALLMGVDAAERQNFIAWSETLAEFIGTPGPTRALTLRAQDALLAMCASFNALISERRRKPQDDLVSLLVQAADAGQIQGETELLAQCAMLLFAGHETTRNLLGNGLLALLQTGAWQKLQTEPALLPAAVRELLRYDSPVQYTGRRVASDLILHGRQLRRGDLVVALIGAANRDPARYTQPDQLDFTRKQAMPLSFGTGPHICIGAGLSLIEAELVFSRLLQRWPTLQLHGAPQRNSNAVYRGLQTLHVSTQPLPGD